MQPKSKRPATPRSRIASRSEAIAPRGARRFHFLGTLCCTWALLAAAALAGGCQGPPATATVPELPHRDATVRVACPGEPAATIVSTYGKGWAQREGVRLEVQRYDPGADPPVGDVWVIPPAELGRWAAAGKLLPVPESVRTGGYGWNRLLPIYRDHLLVWDRTACALPLLGEAPLCFYRADLFASPDHQKAFATAHGRKLAPPTTWEEFAALAEFFSRQEGVPGPPLPPLPDSDEELDRLFYQVAAPFARRAVPSKESAPPGRKGQEWQAETLSFHYDLDTGQVRIDTPGFVEALQLLQRLQDLRPPGTHPAPPEAFAHEKAVLCVADASWIERFQQGKVQGRFGICPVPGASCYFHYRTGERVEVEAGNRVPYLGSGGWLAVVPASSTQPEAAFALLAELSGLELSRQIVYEPKWGGGPFRHEHLDSPTGWDSFGLEPSQTLELREYLRQTLLHTGLRNPVFSLRTPSQREHVQALVAELRPALREKRAAAEVLAGVARRWRELDGSKDPRARLAEYRLNLGLGAGR